MLPLRLHNFLTRLRHWEYWPMHVVYLPIYAYWLLLAARARSFFYFSAANPGIPSGGMLGESKFDILAKIPAAYKPVTLRLKPSVPLGEVLERMNRAGIRFPVVAKPDVGERGWMVEKITGVAALSAYLRRIRVDFLVQPYVAGPLELGVFYYRLPGAARGEVSSVVVKDFLKITGDGASTVEMLVRRNPRAALQHDRLRERYPADWTRVLPRGMVMELEPIGNHCRGTAFLDGTSLINDRLREVFDRISRAVDGFYYGRYDLRCAGLDGLYAGEGIQVVELNGVGAEPGHIYQPGFSLWEGYRVLFRHWTAMYRIARLNHRRGVPYLRLGEVRQTLRRIRRARALCDQTG
ncbi:MAG: hypothetical protein ICV83_25530 [Cytophagales bacterium]|nr:hypothetical protein [Cytophagales bacterium]